ncbi:glycosyltransferase family 2 protein [Carboxylicivirga sp. M1479]|uniref:glycosyltransferase n=1 Tax=Carboxylicivirga sp. M1479 TaxID=2594476 RepID=UPI0011785D01|nr:glycosyltransferase [Carboxylicivirga sp. M1479]TRX70457.1 glycosyltransferase [Carboxylicivirga sp. M1479]
MHFSVIIPIYNRPDEIIELLESLTLQSAQSVFEVIIIEDGSNMSCKDVIEPYFNQIDLHYYTQDNTGPGPARNHGAKKAKGDYLIFFDSDCIIPSNYFNHVLEHLDIQPLDCFGGPDEAHPFFTPIQKAISYSMTSPITTGGIRGGGKKMDKFYPRSFNLGIKKGVFEALNGFSDMRFGEDLDLSMRTMKSNYSVGLIKEANVYHKRRTHFRAFFKQVFNSGIARIDLSMLHAGTLKPVHLLPSLFTIAYPILLILGLFFSKWFLALFMLFPLVIFLDALKRTKSFYVSLLSTWASLIQLIGYGTGFISAFWVRIIKRKGAFHSFAKSFYD